MTEVKSREIRLKQRPTGMPDQSTFDLAETTVGPPGDGQVLVRNIWMTVDPYMRGRMVDRKSYVPPFQVGAVLDGGAIGQVVAGGTDKLKVGDYVNSMMGWREAFVSDGKALTKVDPSLAPVQSYLGALGMPGLTAYGGLLRIGEPKEGETVFVSAASGAVGSIVCQVAKAKGCRVVASAGSDEKLAWLKDVAKVDEIVNYKTCASLHDAVKAACPDGIDIYFENVGGEHLQVALDLMNPHGRLVMCGVISQYNAPEPVPGPSNLFNVIGKRLRMEGFIVTDYFGMMNDFHRDMGKWVAEGRMHWKETALEGIENAPQAFLNLFSGDNFGKMLVKIGPDPAV